MTKHLIEDQGGVKVIAVQKATPANTFDAQLFFRAGAGHEVPELAGISHFLEHTIFLGTRRHRTRTAVETNLLSFGGNYNAATGVDATSLSLSGGLDRSPTALEDGAASLFDIGMDASLDDEKEISKEKKVVISELEQELTETGGWSDPLQVACETLFSGSVLAQSILGSKKTLRRIGPQQLLQYHRAHYHRGSACLAVVTPLPPEETLRRLAKVKAPGRALKAHAPLPVPEPPRGVALKGIEASTYTWDLDFFFHFQKPATVKELVATKVMSLVLFHSELSALFGEARKRGLVYMAHGAMMSFLGTHLYRVSTTLAPAKAQKFWNLFRTQVRRLCAGEIDAQFLNFCKAHFSYTRQVMREHYGLYLSRVVEKEFMREGAPLPEEEAEALASVGVAEIVAAARSVFSSPSRVVTVKGPDMERGGDQELRRQGAFSEVLVS